MSEKRHINKVPFPSRIKSNHLSNGEFRQGKAQHEAREFALEHRTAQVARESQVARREEPADITVPPDNNGGHSKDEASGQRLRSHVHKSHKNHRHKGFAKGIVVVIGLMVIIALVLPIGDNTGLQRMMSLLEGDVYLDVKTDEHSLNYVNYAEKLEVLDSDINFSQAGNSFEKTGVQVLVKVKNDNEFAIGKLDFMIAQGDRVVANRETDTDYFSAYGYVEANETGYVFAQIHIDNKTERKQGDIVLVDAAETKNSVDYQMPAGVVCGFDDKADAYSVRIINPNTTSIAKGEAVIIAIRKDYQNLSDSWGAGELHQDIDAGSSAVLENIIKNPGFREYNEDNYGAFVIDKAVL